jgi:hypothetical protein
LIVQVAGQLRSRHLPRLPQFPNYEPYSRDHDETRQNLDPVGDRLRVHLDAPPNSEGDSLANQIDQANDQDGHKSEVERSPCQASPIDAKADMAPGLNVAFKPCSNYIALVSGV